ncbi:hypothetical protein EPO44_08875 [bacterium]|nr:MAG: hypothetical protein EPO44_08875 [bacterium]
MARMIPGEITLDEFREIRDCLVKVLTALKSAAQGADPIWVSCRLNESDVKDPSPYFVGWVEDTKAKDERVRRNDPEPGLYRFGDDYYSQIYEECLKNPVTVIGINEVDQKIIGKTDRMLWLSGARSIAFKSGGRYRRSIAIKVGNRCVGTLNAGFRNDPGAGADGTLKDWAENRGKDLITCLNGLDLNFGGPTF